MNASAHAGTTRAGWRSASPVTWGLALAAAVVLSAGAAALAAQRPDRSKAPVPGPPPALKLPPLQKRTLSNGLPVWIVEMHEVPVVDVAIVIKSGASADPAGKYGLASFAAAMLDEGAGSRDALVLADAVDFLGASLSTSSGFDNSSVRLHVPVRQLELGLPLMADVVLRPTFGTAEIERLRKERLTSLLQTRDNPAALASAGFARVLYGPRHRYGTPAGGNDASNGEMTAADRGIVGREHVLGPPPGPVALDYAGDRHIADLERLHGPCPSC